MWKVVTLKKKQVWKLEASVFPYHCRSTLETHLDQANGVELLQSDEGQHRGAVTFSGRSHLLVDHGGALEEGVRGRSR